MTRRLFAATLLSLVLAPPTLAAGSAAATTATAVIPVTTATTVPTAQAWNFRVFLDDTPIGRHSFSLRRDGDESELRSEARFEVKVLFVTAYRYAHQAVERWRGNCLAGLTASTDDDGQRQTVETRGGAGVPGGAGVSGGGRLDADRLVVVRREGSQPLSGCVMTYAYWNPDILQQSRLLNAQTGEWDPVRISDAGEERIAVRGVPVSARRYRIAGPKHPIDVWYSAQREWLALESTVAGGRKLKYRIE